MRREDEGTLCAAVQVKPDPNHAMAFNFGGGGAAKSTASGGGLFGGGAKPGNAGGGLFGGGGATNTGGAGGGLFGGGTNSAAAKPAGGGLFGGGATNNAAAKPATGGGLFGGAGGAKRRAMLQAVGCSAVQHLRNQRRVEACLAVPKTLRPLVVVVYLVAVLKNQMHLQAEAYSVVVPKNQHQRGFQLNSGSSLTTNTTNTTSMQQAGQHLNSVAGESRPQLETLTVEDIVTEWEKESPITSGIFNVRFQK